MANRLSLLREQLLGTLWFVPAVIVAASLFLAVGMVELSARVDQDALARWPRVFGAEPGSSRAILSAIASSMITVAGLSFSLTMVAVTQASTQYTPRILRSFTADRANQMVLGTFVGIFAYCLVVLRTIRSDDEGARFVPSLAVVLGIVLAIVGIGVLIFFVHHISTTLEASNLVSRLADETGAAISAIYPEPLGSQAEHTPARSAAMESERFDWCAIAAPASGYVQRIDEDRLVVLAAEHGRIIRMERGIGEFVIAESPLVSVTGNEATPNRFSSQIISCFTIGAYRTVEQDAAFGIRQLVDIALKALSPGVNDSTTAVSCVDYLGAVLVRLADRHFPEGVRSSSAAPPGAFVLTRHRSFESMLSLACDEIRQNATGNVAILRRLFDMLGELAAVTRTEHRSAMVAAQRALVHEVAERTVSAPYDRAMLKYQYENPMSTRSTVRPPL